MRNRKPLLVAIPALLFGAALPAQEYAPRCDLSQAAAGEHAAQAGQSARLADVSRATLGQFDLLMKSRAWSQEAPVREQMSTSERQALVGIQAQMQANLVAQLFESRRERDIRVIARMAQMADTRAHAPGGPTAEEASEEHSLLWLLAGLDAMSRPAIDDRTTADAADCTLEHALWDAAVAVANKGAAMPELQHMAATTARLASKYGSPIPAPENLEPTDRELFDSMVPALQRMRATRVHAESLLKLALLESASKAMLRAWHQDQNEMPGDISYTGTTWQRWVQQGKVSPAQHQMIALLNAINQRFPADPPPSPRAD